MKKKIAVIFAGGKSSRMGEDKALLPFGGYNSLAEYQYKRVSKLFDSVYISAKSNKFDFEVNIIKDCYNASSPLVGIISIFDTLDIDEVFILSVDTPFVNRDIIDKLYNEALPTKDIIIAKSYNGVEPLCGIYRRGVVSIAKLFLEQNNHRLQDLFKKVDTQYVLYRQKDVFINLNYPNEYQKAIRMSLLSSD